MSSTVGYNMQVLDTDIAGIKLLKLVRHVDTRGFFLSLQGKCIARTGD
jgi:hypothetical protein